jgi:hypothetical protein
MKICPIDNSVVIYLTCQDCDYQKECRLGLIKLEESSMDAEKMSKQSVENAAKRATGSGKYVMDVLEECKNDPNFKSGDPHVFILKRESARGSRFISKVGESLIVFEK